MTPETAEAGKQIAGWIAIIVAAAVTAAITAWRARGRRDRVPVYAGPADDTPRKITRKEWHDVVDPVNEHGLKLYAHDLRLTALERDVTGLQGEFSSFLLAARQTGETLTRVGAEFTAHVKRQEELGTRAEQDRVEILRRLERIEGLARGNGAHS